MTYTGNSITITDQPNADVNITLPTAQPQSNTVRTVSDKFCYAYKKVWKVTDLENCYASTVRSDNDSEWILCTGGTINILYLFGENSFKYPETPECQVSECQSIEYEMPGNIYFELKVAESGYGKKKILRKTIGISSARNSNITYAGNTARSVVLGTSEISTDGYTTKDDDMGNCKIGDGTKFTAK